MGPGNSLRNRLRLPGFSCTEPGPTSGRGAAGCSVTGPLVRTSMRLITAITPSGRRQGRFSIDVDDREVATLSIEAIERLNLAVGTSFDEATAIDVERESGILATYDRAMNMLAARGRAAMDLRRALVKKGEPAPFVDAAIARLERAGFLDDRAYAVAFVRSKVLAAGMSRRRVQQELAKRGVSRDVALEATSAVFADEGLDEQTSIERVARRKLRALEGADPSTRQRRLYAFLARRGYDASDIGQIMRALLREAMHETE